MNAAILDLNDEFVIFASAECRERTQRYYERVVAREGLVQASRRVVAVEYGTKN